ncbi:MULTISPECIES: Sec-independent protein translocase protein TatB [Thauera]|jgi:sec-independent protein translocase protein TatB|uniref:Sec-independent protein translocase protein TatB n=1 Tax=Thauera TaxID=33057 RepID=UPI00235391C5|nr:MULTISPECIES: Sec-independent protein translocase protein TatB [Thauera]MCK6400227.1 Sec-independent protein translocase protein TatB [Thauera aminoaromatica]MCK6409981.1 Sec-independent protein translocase protein TatB [Thauera sp.]
MFDFGFSELVVIGIVMLIVVGPERLPKVARTAGHLLGRVQRYVSDVKSDIQREMQLEELKKLQEQVRQQAQEIESSVRSGVAGVESGVGQTVDEVRSILPDSARPAATPVPPSVAAPSSATVAPATPGGEGGAPAGTVRDATAPQREPGLEAAPRVELNADKAKA